MRILAGLLLVAAVTGAQDVAVDMVLSVWDANQDGVLSKDELPDNGIFEKVDKDGDGTLTRAELAVFFRTKAEPPAKKEKRAKARPAPEKKKSDVAMQEPRTVKERVADLFRRLDVNKDGKLQRAELTAVADEVFQQYDRTRNGEWNRREATRWVKDSVAAAKRRPNARNFFQLFDMNRDKKVTKQEYDGPGDFFRRYDHDKDKVITEGELAMGPDAGRMQRGDKEFMADGPTRMPKRNLLERYDANGDGRVTLAELGNAESVLKRLDKNGDGVLSGSEVR
ncbi:MAG: EF-hand domain-containing protein [Planctomycetota bacterium]|jgi:Ca2+-binding EF-hand superfamily protein